MGTGRTFSRPPSRLRSSLVAASVGALFIIYLLLPHSFDADGLFPTDSRNGHRPRIQFDFRRNRVVAGDPDKAAAVRKTMQDTFWKYRKAAWGMDEVRPISGGNRTSRNGWAATLVDTLTTLVVMGLETEFLLELEYATTTLDFSNAVDLVDPFETTIRYLGALVSTVDLLDANINQQQFARPVPRASRDALVRQAVSLAHKLAPGFDTPTGMIWPRINFTEGVGCREEESERPYPDYDHATIGPARAGSNWLENYGLSRLTGNPAFVDNATRAWSPLVYNKWAEEWPGVIDAPWDIMTGKPFDRHRSWGAGHDSYYEYLIKAHILAPSDPHSAKYRDRWLQAVESTRDHLLHRGTVNGAPERYPNAPLFLHQHRNGWLVNEMGHLACFAGGNFMLGGAYLKRSDILELGKELVETCRRTYEATATRIGPEYWRWEPAGHISAFTAESEWHQHQHQQTGWWVVDARWMLRPETVESYFYAYRITGDKKYQSWAWDAYTAFVAASRADHGYAEVQDVTHPPGESNRADKQESFWGAETLKYLYLIFCDDSVASLDQFVFSTEAHLFRILG